MDIQEICLSLEQIVSTFPGTLPVPVTLALPCHWVKVFILNSEQILPSLNVPEEIKQNGDRSENGMRVEKPNAETLR